MKLATRAAATATAVLSISALTMPVANAASTGHGYGSGKIRVCVQGLRGGEADVFVARQSKEIHSGDCRTFRGLRPGRTYRVVADADSGCRVFGAEKYVTARRDARTVVFFGRCFEGNRRFDRGDGMGRGDGRWDGMGRGDGQRDGNGRGDGQRDGNGRGDGQRDGNGRGDGPPRGQRTFAIR